MKKIIVPIIMLILLFNLSYAIEITKTVDLNNAWTIEKQDYFEKYVDYKFEYYNETTYLLKYKVIDENPFNVIANCFESKENDCIDKLVEENNIILKDTEKNTESFLGFGSTYSKSEFIDTYFEGYDEEKIKTDYKDMELSLSVPKETLKGDAIIRGYVNPVLFKENILIIELPNGIYNSDGTKIKIGYGSLIATFNNSLTTENLPLGLINGFYQNQSRYLEIPRYSNISSASMNVSGYSTYSGIYPYTDNIQSGSLDTTTKFSSSSSSTFASGSVTAWNNPGTYAITSMSATDSAGTGSSILSLDKSATYSTANNNTIVISYTVSCSKDWSTSSSGGIYVGTTPLRVTDCPFVGYIPGSNTITEVILIKVNSTNITVYNANTYTKITEIPYVSGYYIFRIDGSITGGNDARNSISTSMRINYIGNNINFTQYNNFVGGNTYPNITKIYIGSTLAYTNNTQLVAKTNVSLKSYLVSAINNGLCDCSGCIATSLYCYPPVKFTSINGGGITYSGISINLTYAYLNITFRDELTNEIVNTTNITAVFNSITRSFNQSTTNGRLQIDWSDFNDYNIRYSASNYVTRNRIFKYDGTQNPTLILYMAQYNQTVTKIFQVEDETGKLIQNAQVQIWKYLNSINGFADLFDKETDPNGQVTFDLIPLTDYYRFVVLYNGNVVWNNSNILGNTITTDTAPIRLKILSDISENVVQDIIDTLSVDRQFLLSTDNSSGYLNLIINTNSLSSNVCFRVTNTDTETILFNNCSTSTGTHSYFFNVTKATNLQTESLLNYNGEYYYIAENRFYSVGGVRRSFSSGKPCLHAISKELGSHIPPSG